MFKILSIAIGCYFLYRLINKPESLDSGPASDSLKEEEDLDYTDYEEVD